MRNPVEVRCMCGAKPNEECRTTVVGGGEFHADRIAEARKPVPKTKKAAPKKEVPVPPNGDRSITAFAQMYRCAVCKAPPGNPCTGTRVEVHTPRKKRGSTARAKWKAQEPETDAYTF